MVVSEVFANADPPQTAPESIELFNPTQQPIDVSGWYLSDSADNLEKYRIPDSTVLQPGAYLVIQETEYNPTPNEPLPSHFGLSSTNGDDVWLVSVDNDGRRQFVDDVHFGPSVPGESLSSYSDVSAGLLRTRPTLGGENGLPILSSLIISEIQYAPAPPTAAALELDADLTERDLEFIELYNRSPNTVPLSGVQLRAGVDYEFELMSDLAAGEALVVVSFDPTDEANQARVAAFKSHYQLDDSVRLVGGFSNRLSDTGELVQLTLPGRPLGIDDYVVEQVAYDDQVPWPVPNDSERSLQRVNDQVYGAFADAWLLQEPSPGRVEFSGERLGDFSGDGQLDVRDVDLLWAQLRAAVDDPAFDLTGDQRVNEQDRDRMIESILGTSYGDADLNRRFDSSDFVLVFRAGEYEDAIAGNSTWETGDWNADGDFTTADLVLAFQSGMYVANAKSMTPRE